SSGPAKRGGLLAPYCEKPAPVLDCLLPPLDRDVVRTVLLKRLVSTTYTTEHDQRCLWGTSVVFGRIGRTCKWLSDEVEVLTHKSPRSACCEPDLSGVPAGFAQLHPGSPPRRQ